MTMGRHTGPVDATERNRMAIRGTIVLVVVVALLFGWVGISIINFSQDLKDQQTSNQKSRLEDQKRTDLQIAQLACLVVSQTNEDKPGFDPSSRIAIKKYRAFYGCPPYSEATAKDPFGKAAMPHPTSPVPNGFVPRSSPEVTPAHPAQVKPDVNPTPSGTRPAGGRTTTHTAAPPVIPTPSATPTESVTPLLSVCPTLPVLGNPVCLELP